MAQITALTSFPNYTDYKNLGSMAYAEAVKTWFSQLLTFQTETNAVRDEVVSNAAITSDKATLATQEADRATAQADVATAQATTAANKATLATQEADRATSEADRAAASISLLPDGTINDVVLGSNITFSSNKIKNITAFNTMPTKTTDYTAVVGDYIPVNTSTNAVAITAPLTPSVGDKFIIDNESDVNTLSINGNGTQMMFRGVLGDGWDTNIKAPYEVRFDGTNWRIN